MIKITIRVVREKNKRFEDGSTLHWLFKEVVSIKNLEV